MKINTERDMHSKEMYADIRLTITPSIDKNENSYPITDSTQLH
jgi:hypothetical protein